MSLRFDFRREYRSWSGARERCANENSPDFPRYGGVVIRVCERWASFDAFLADMGPRPIGTSLDRVNNDGHYEPGNCRWATPHQQRANRSRSWQEQRPWTQEKLDIWKARGRSIRARQLAESSHETQ